MGGDFSVELCGGTNVAQTGDIGLLRISGESSVAAGVRSIEAVTGAKAVELCDQLQDTIADVSSLVRASGGNVADKVQQLVDDNRRMQK